MSVAEDVGRIADTAAAFAEPGEELAGVLAVDTLGRRVYVAAGIAQTEIETLLRHELTHVQQIARVGLFRFYWRYAAEYIALRRRGVPSAEAYRRISFEVEAFAAEKTL